MPVYLFTWHGYGTWMPDRPRGYVKRDKGVLPPDEHMAECYRELAVGAEVHFVERHQRVMIDELLKAAPRQRLHLHGVATDLTHLHALLSWWDERPWKAVRRSARSSLTRRLNQAFEHREWLSEGGGRKDETDDEHFSHLMQNYLPKHSGLQWYDDGRGWC